MFLTEWLDVIDAYGTKISEYRLKWGDIGEQEQSWGISSFVKGKFDIIAHLPSHLQQGLAQFVTDLSYFFVNLIMVVATGFGDLILSKGWIVYWISNLFGTLIATFSKTGILALTVLGVVGSFSYTIGSHIIGIARGEFSGLIGKLKSWSKGAALISIICYLYSLNPYKILSNVISLLNNTLELDGDYDSGSPYERSDNHKNFDNVFSTTLRILTLGINTGNVPDSDCQREWSQTIKYSYLPTCINEYQPGTLTASGVNAGIGLVSIIISITFALAILIIVYKASFFLIVGSYYVFILPFKAAGSLFTNDGMRDTMLVVNTVKDVAKIALKNLGVFLVFYFAATYVLGSVYGSIFENDDIPMVLKLLLMAFVNIGIFLFLRRKVFLSNTNKYSTWSTLLPAIKSFDYKNAFKLSSTDGDVLIDKAFEKMKNVRGGENYGDESESDNYSTLRENYENEENLSHLSPLISIASNVDDRESKSLVPISFFENHVVEITHPYPPDGSSGDGDPYISPNKDVSVNHNSVEVLIDINADNRDNNMMTKVSIPYENKALDFETFSTLGMYKDTSKPLFAVTNSGTIYKLPFLNENDLKSFYKNINMNGEYIQSKGKAVERFLKFKNDNSNSGDRDNELRRQINSVNKYVESYEFSNGEEISLLDEIITKNHILAKFANTLGLEIPEELNTINNSYHNEGLAADGGQSEFNTVEGDFSYRKIITGTIDTSRLTSLDKLRIGKMLIFIARARGVIFPTYQLLPGDGDGSGSKRDDVFTLIKNEETGSIDIKPSNEGLNGELN